MLLICLLSVCLSAMFAGKIHCQESVCLYLPTYLPVCHVRLCFLFVQLSSVRNRRTRRTTPPTPLSPPQLLQVRSVDLLSLIVLLSDQQTVKLCEVLETLLMIQTINELIRVQLKASLNQS